MSQVNDVNVGVEAAAVAVEGVADMEVELYALGFPNVFCAICKRQSISYPNLHKSKTPIKYDCGKKAADHSFFTLTFRIDRIVSTLTLTPLP